jgi:2-methylcitrate dehydratase PrpD
MMPSFHLGAQLSLATLAVAEETDASSQSLLEALVIGYEVAVRAGRCWRAHYEIDQSCGSRGSVACAAS